MGGAGGAARSRASVYAAAAVARISKVPITKNPGMKPGLGKPRRTSGHDDQAPLSTQFLKKCGAHRAPRTTLRDRRSRRLSSTAISGAVSSARPCRSGAAREAPSQAAADRCELHQQAIFLPGAVRRQLAFPMLKARVPRGVADQDPALPELSIAFSRADFVK